MSTGVNDPNRCQWCSNFHTGICPYVKAIEYHPNGSVKRVEFHSAVPQVSVKEFGANIADAVR